MTPESDLEKGRSELLLLRLQILEAKVDLLLTRSATLQPVLQAENQTPPDAKGGEAVRLSLAAETAQSTPLASASSNLEPSRSKFLDLRLQRVKFGKVIDIVELFLKSLALPVAIFTIWLTWQKIPQLYLDEQKTRAETVAAQSASQLADSQRTQIVALGHSNMSGDKYISEVSQIVSRSNDSLAGLAIRLLLIYAAFKIVGVFTSFIELFWGWLVHGLAYTLQGLQRLAAPKTPTKTPLFATQQLEALKRFQAPARLLVLISYAVVVALVVWPAIMYSCAMLGKSELPQSLLAALSHLEISRAVSESSTVFGSR